MRRPAVNALKALIVRQRRRLRESELAFILLAVLAGIAAGWLTNLQSFLAHAIQQVLYGVTGNRLSAIGEIRHPIRLLALPFGGLLLVGIAYLLRHRRRAPIDVVEGNALHSGRIPFIDNLIISAQTIVSNGAGASVGLEAAYAQMGGGVASVLGQWFKLRRADMRTLVGAGAGAAVGAAFGAPLAGAFYAFEIVIGTYTPAAIAPVIAAALGAAFITRQLGVEPYLIAASSQLPLTTGDYFIYALLGLICALVGILLMRMVTFAEMHIQRLSRITRWRPLIGGMLLMPLAWISPQSLSAGHGAMHLNLAMQPAIQFLLLVLVLKIAASVISLSFGFRGGLFFASLFLGSLVGLIFAGAVQMLPFGIQLDPTQAALVGMSGLAVSVVGGPMTLAMLILETTHDFALMGVVLTAALVSSAFTRETFGYSFSTWRLHIRGSIIRSPRDIGWMLSLTAGRIMRTDWVSAPATLSLSEFRARVPLGSASKAILLDAEERYAGIVSTASAWNPELDPEAEVGTLATLVDTSVAPATDIRAMLKAFDMAVADELAVVDGVGKVVGVVTERHARRRYFEEIEASQRELFGET
ncbi:CIC family chloride channel protein [Novosphingobium sp. PhB165]|uniref:chloride channel protein n=1 Tax=Novosphingobium sp. PhB165 TaxID=2485105 RepID=UPI0010479E59|nr:chloride channel protein [Novosphingobium sp. PhB165]TCM19397.1 CIC family chloride channel protein [Novosphingobium sp. PhB165]